MCSAAASRATTGRLQLEFSRPISSATPSASMSACMPSTSRTGWCGSATTWSAASTAAQWHFDAGLNWTIGSKQELRVKLQAIGDRCAAAPGLARRRRTARGRQRRAGRRLQRAQPRLPDPLPLRARAAVVPVHRLRARRLPGGCVLGRVGRSLRDSFELRDDEQLLVNQLPLRAVSRSVSVGWRLSEPLELWSPVEGDSRAARNRRIRFRPSRRADPRGARRSYRLTSRKSADAIRHARCSAVAPSTTVRCRVYWPA